MSAPALDLARARLRLRAERAIRDAWRDSGEWGPWLRSMFPRHFSGPFATHQGELWDWSWSIQPGERARPFVGVWARGGGKSTSAEAAVCALGARGVRRYVLYVRSTQDQADKSVANIASMLESEPMGRRYPLMSERMVGKYGASRGWRRNRLRTASGFTVDAVGLDAAVRGIKVDEERPDLIVLDDVDDREDTEAATAKKVRAITRSILPAGAKHLAVLGIQNLIIPNGIFSQLADGRADFLVDRIVSGPHPAVYGLQTEPQYDATLERWRDVIVAGEPSWGGQDLDACQKYIDTFGLTAFTEECQHEVKVREGALWTPDLLARQRWTGALPEDLYRFAVGVDPSGGGEEIGIVGGGLARNGHAFVLRDASQEGAHGPLNWGKAAVRTYHDLDADRMVAEVNFGGDMVVSNVKVAARDPDFEGKRVVVRKVTASRGKVVRAEPIAAEYQAGRVWHVGTFPQLEAEMTWWKPGDKDSPNRLDALVWMLTELMGKRVPGRRAPLHY